MTVPASTSSDSFRRVTRRMPCPICGNSRWCSFIGDWGVHCMRVEAGSRKPANSGEGWIHVLAGHEPDWREVPLAPRPAPPRVASDPTIVDSAYRALLKHCPLSDPDRAHLRRRGLSDDQIALHGYATLPVDPLERSCVTSAVLADLDTDPGGVVPGFIRQQAVTVLTGMAGILIPFRDAQGRIAGLQVRVRNPRDGAKYLWFSGGNGPGSIGQNGNTVHVAIPTGNLRTSWIVITEGVIKANIVADHFGCRALAVAGVSNTANVVDTIEHLGDATDVVIAYDADAEQHPHIAAAEHKLACACAAAGLRVAQWQWPLSHGKGIDDLLTTSNLLPFPIPHPALASCTAVDMSPSPPPKELAAARALHALSTQAHRSPNLGAERHLLTDLALTLAAAPEGEAVPLPYPKLADLAGVSPSTVERSLGKVGIRPKEGASGLLEGLIAVDIRPVPEQCNAQTGEVTGGYEAMHVRRLAPVTDILSRIAQAPVPAAGPKNGHGGRRCAKCGCSQVRQTITEHCAKCGDLVRQITRTVDRGQDDPSPQDAVESMNVEPAAIHENGLEDAPPQQDAVESTHTLAHGSGDVRVISFPPSDAAGGRQHLAAPRDTLPVEKHSPGVVMTLNLPPHHAARSGDQERKARAARSLAAWQDRPRADVPGGHQETQSAATCGSARPQPLPLFELTPSEACVTCGAAAARGQAYCHSCDPRGA